MEVCDLSVEVVRNGDGVEGAVDDAEGTENEIGVGDAEVGHVEDATLHAGTCGRERAEGAVNVDPLAVRRAAVDGVDGGGGVG